ncbi:MAG: hypothetical protein AABN34_06415 [Acidobacteriota bacterium]
MRSERTLAVFQTLVVGVAATLLASRIERVRVDSLTVGFVAVVIVGLAFYIQLPRRLWSLLGLDAVVVSALVFDGDKILLVRDDQRQPPWLVPPSAHVGCFTSLRWGPHQAVIRTIRRETGIEIEMPTYPMGAATTQITLPFFAQSEKQWSGEGHHTHHDFYYVGTLASPRKVFGARGTYDWYVVEDLGRIQGVAIPYEMIKVIKDARDFLKQSEQE